jgi:effector-binding domain-containing protein
VPFYRVTLERTTACPTAVVKANTTWREFPEMWRAMLDEVWAFLGSRPGLRTDGHNVMVYRRDIPDVEVAVEVGVQVTGSFEAEGRVVPSELPAGQAATTIHTGPPANLEEAHVAVKAWCAARGHRLTGVAWEIYGDPDPETDHFDTEVYWELV